MNWWQIGLLILLSVWTGSLVTLAGVVVGGLFVFRTKRESHETLLAPKTGDGGDSYVHHDPLGSDGAYDPSMDDPFKGEETLDNSDYARLTADLERRLGMERSGNVPTEVRDKYDAGIPGGDDKPGPVSAK